MTIRLEFNNEKNSEKYEFEAICNKKIHTKESDSGYYLIDLYHLVLWKSYLEEENTGELILAI